MAAVLDLPAAWPDVAHTHQDERRRWRILDPVRAAAIVFLCHGRRSHDCAAGRTVRRRPTIDELIHGATGRVPRHADGGRHPRLIPACGNSNLCVMAGLGPATHDFSSCHQQSRGWPAFAGHDTGELASMQSGIRCGTQERRGWRPFARHDGVGLVRATLEAALVGRRPSREWPAFAGHDTAC